MYWILVLVLLMRISEASLKLQFFDEFESESIDSNKWDLISYECDRLNQLNCYNNTQHLRLINGTLALAPIRQKHLNKYYTSSISTKETFNSGKFEIRAALPLGKKAKISIRLNSMEENGWIVLLDKIEETNRLMYGFQYNHEDQQYNVGHSITLEGVSNFNTYTLEWTQSEVIWSFNGRALHKINTSVEMMNEGKPFIKEIKLNISLDVIQRYDQVDYSDKDLLQHFSHDRNCSLLILDYIRIYQNKTDQGEGDVKLPEQNNITSSEVCAQFNHLSKPKKQLKLIFSEEFTDNKKTFRYEWNRRETCDHMNQLNCYTDETNNLRIVDGSLVLTAIRQKYLGKYFTTPWIYTDQSFTYGRIEIRAALPNAKMIKPHIFMTPVNHRSWPEGGEIFIMYSTTEQQIEYGINFQRDSEHKFLGNNSVIDENLNDFNIYVLEWTESEMTWIFNNKILHTINITKELANNYNPFSKPFKLDISLSVGGDYYLRYGHTLYDRDVDGWNCSLMIIDYIRIYQNVTDEMLQVDGIIVPEHDSRTSSQVCNDVMPLIRHKKQEWKLIYSDEFMATSSIDTTKWEIRNENCHAEDLIKCQIDPSANIKLINGTLALDENYMSSYNLRAISFTTKQSFTQGRFEIRAALPFGKSVRPEIYLEPSEKYDSRIEMWPKEQRINIVSGLHSSSKFFYGSNHINKSQTIDTLFNFHTYVMEWTETEIIWMFGDNHLYTANIIKDLEWHNNELEQPFKLKINLLINELLFNSRKERVDVEDISCSTMILDYVRIYQRSDDISAIEIPEQNNITTSKICYNVFSYEYSTQTQNVPDSSNLWIVIICISIISIVLTIIVLNIFIGRKNRYNSTSIRLNDSIEDIAMEATL